MYFLYPLAEGLNSYTVPKKELKAHGCFTILDVRRSIHESRCDQALEGLKNDMTHHFYENSCDVLPTTESKMSGSWVALAMPNAIPSRLGLMTCISSLMMLCDDAEQTLSIPAATTKIRTTRSSATRFAGDLEAAVSDSTIDHSAPDVRITTSIVPTSHTTAALNILNPVIQSLLSTDYNSGLEILKAWHAYYRNFSTVYDPPTSLAEYLDTCDRKFPIKPWMALLRHAFGLHLHERELDLIQPAVEAAMQSMALTRDYWAWPKISRGAVNNKRVGNAVAVTMAEHSCVELEASALVRDAALAAEERFLDLKVDVAETLEEGQSEVIMFLEAVEQFAGGNSLWCSSCPRFHGRR